MCYICWRLFQTQTFTTNPLYVLHLLKLFQTQTSTIRPLYVLPLLKLFQTQTFITNPFFVLPLLKIVPNTNIEWIASLLVGTELTWHMMKVRTLYDMRKFCFIFSAPEPKAQVHYCDQALSVVRPSVRPSVVNFSHFRLLLWNRWTEFNETWQEARTQHPLD